MQATGAVRPGEIANGASWKNAYSESTVAPDFIAEATPAIVAAIGDADRPYHSRYSGR